MMVSMGMNDIFENKIDLHFESASFFFMFTDCVNITVAYTPRTDWNREQKWHAYSIYLMFILYYRYIWTNIWFITVLINIHIYTVPMDLESWLVFCHLLVGFFLWTNANEGLSIGIIKHNAFIVFIFCSSPFLCHFKHFLKC